jgi:DNA-binding NtrC family response regulator
VGQSNTLDSLVPEWFSQREVIPLDDHLALVVCHESMRSVVETCRDIACLPSPVLITGETGVGKSLLARFIHVSQDPYSPFVSATTAGLDATMLSSMLFNDGPIRLKSPALVDQAVEGTLVLEEIGDFPRTIQKRLLYVWEQEKQGLAKDLEAVSHTIRSPVRWICTTNLSLRKLLSPGLMLPGFLQSFKHVHVPPLRERKQDIPALLPYLFRLNSSKQPSLHTLETLSKRLARHKFPGNVRELESFVLMEARGMGWESRLAGLHQGLALRKG